MSPVQVIKTVKERFPELQKLSKAEFKVVEKAIVYAAQLQDLVGDAKHRELMKKIEGKGGITPANSLKAYRLRSDLTQQELAKRSGISQANISAMEHGRRPIGLNASKKLAKILDCDYRKLI